MKSLVYVAMRRKIILYLTRHVPVNEDDDKSCYAVLLLHSIWPNGNEDDILGSPPVTPVVRLRYVRLSNMLPGYVESFLENLVRSENVIDTHGEPQRGIEEEHEGEIVDESERAIEWHVDGNDDDDGIMEDDEVEHQILVDMELSKSGRVRENVCKTKMDFLRNFIGMQQKKFMDNFLLQNQLLASDCLPDPDVRFANPKWKLFEESLSTWNLADKQRECFDLVISFLTGIRCGQMMAFLSGEGGT